MYVPVIIRGPKTLFLSIPSDLNSIVIPPTKLIMSLIRFYWIANNYFSQLDYKIGTWPNFKWDGIVVDTDKQGIQTQTDKLGCFT